MLKNHQSNPYSKQNPPIVFQIKTIKNNTTKSQNRLTFVRLFCKIQCDADVAELADALDSGSSESFFHMGSSPFICTKQNTDSFSVFFCCLKGLCAIAPHFVCEPIFYGWRSLLQTSLSVRYYAHFVLYKSLHLHQTKHRIVFGVFLLFEVFNNVVFTKRKGEIFSPFCYSSKSLK